jgi:hypothetical protein
MEKGKEAEPELGHKTASDRDWEKVLKMLKLVSIAPSRNKEMYFIVRHCIIKLIKFYLCESFAVYTARV